MTLKASAEQRWTPGMAPLQENDHDPPRYIPVEALILLFLADSDRFPNIDSVYVHDQYYAIAMTPCVDDTPDRHPTPSGNWKREFPTFTGRFLMETNHTPVLDEMQACKVASQLLQALFNLADMNTWHLDLSVWNFVVDEELNVSRTSSQSAISDFFLVHDNANRGPGNAYRSRFDCIPLGRTAILLY